VTAAVATPAACSARRPDTAHDPASAALSSRNATLVCHPLPITACAQEKGQVSIDWSRYADEDEAEEKGAFDTSQFGGGGMNFGGDDADMMGGGMGGMGGGMGGMGGEWRHGGRGGGWLSRGPAEADGGAGCRAALRRRASLRVVAALWRRAAAARAL